MTTPAVMMKEVRKSYGKKQVFNQLNLTIPRGRVVGILGPNGVGKSTLFRMMMGITSVDQGEIHIEGKHPSWQTTSQVAYLPDRASWYDHHSVEQAFDWAAQFFSDYDRRTAEKLASMMKLPLAMRVQNMSKGQEARLRLIQCLARRVSLMILDEPFSGIDLLSREQIVESLIEQISGTEQTILISTHEISEIEGLFDYAVFLQEGQVVQVGETEQLREKVGSLQQVFRQLYRE